MSKYINADELKVTLLNLADGTKEWGEGVQIGFNSCINALDVMPSADVVEVKHGEWVDKGSLSCRCSNCGCKSSKESKFCPHCGADMWGVK